MVYALHNCTALNIPFGPLGQDSDFITVDKLGALYAFNTCNILKNFLLSNFSRYDSSIRVLKYIIQRLASWDINKSRIMFLRAINY